MLGELAEGAGGSWGSQLRVPGNWLRAPGEPAERRGRGEHAEGARGTRLHGAWEHQLIRGGKAFPGAWWRGRGWV